MEAYDAWDQFGRWVFGRRGCMIYGHEWVGGICNNEDCDAMENEFQIGLMAEDDWAMNLTLKELDRLTLLHQSELMSG